MQLIYRAQIYNYTPKALQPYRKPRVLNWRFHAPGETYRNTPIAVRPYLKPQSLNWRYQMAMGE